MLTCWTIANILAVGLLWVRCGFIQLPSPQTAGAIRKIGERPKSAVSAVGRADPSASPHSEVAEIIEGQARQAGVPRAEFLKRKDRERMVVDRFGFIFEALPNLTPDERTRLSNLLLDWMSLQDDTRSAAAQHGISLDTDSFRKAKAVALAEFNANVAAFCEGCPEVRQFLPLENNKVHLVDIQYAPALDFAGEPLTVQQRIQLAEVLRSLPQPSAGSYSLEAVKEGGALHFETFLTHAAPYLSERQLAVLRARRSVEKALVLRALKRNPHLFQPR